MNENKKAKKVVALLLCAVLLVVGSVTGTMAYLTSKATVTNTFAVGNVTITLDETDVDNSTQGDRDIANAYQLFPGHEYDKDPIVHVQPNSENCYLFVKVENGIEAIETASSEGTIAAQLANNHWKEITIDNISPAGAKVYVYAVDTDAKTMVEKSASVIDKTLFTKFKIASDVVGGNKPNADPSDTNKYLGDYAGATIAVTAYAVQADGFDTKTPAQIWTEAGFN